MAPHRCAPQAGGRRLAPRCRRSSASTSPGTGSQTAPPDVVERARGARLHTDRACALQRSVFALRQAVRQPSMRISARQRSASSMVARRALRVRARPVGSEGLVHRGCGYRTRMLTVEEALERDPRSRRAAGDGAGRDSLGARAGARRADRVAAGDSAVAELVDGRLRGPGGRHGAGRRSDGRRARRGRGRCPRGPSGPARPCASSRARRCRMAPMPSSRRKTSTR